MRSVTVIIQLALLAQAWAEAEDDSIDGLFGMLADDMVEKMFSRGDGVSPSQHANLENTTLGKASTLATPSSSRLSTMSSAQRPAVIAPRLQGGAYRSMPNVMARADTGFSRARAGFSSAMRSRSSAVATRAMPVDETCDPIKMVCTTDAGAPHGGTLINTYVSSEAERTKLVSECATTIELSERQACDVGLIITGGLSPLNGFMKKADYDSVVSTMRLKDNGPLFGLPVVFDTAEGGLQGKKIKLTYKGTDVAVLDAEEEWEPDKKKEAKECYGTEEPDHPTVSELYNGLGKYYVGGKIYGLIPGFDAIWGQGFKTPAEVRATLPEGKQVVAFQNRNPVHKAHFELLVNANEDVPNSIIFVHPTCGPTQPGDIDGPTRIQTYEVLQKDPYYNKWAGDNFRWAYLPYSMKMAGPREAIQHMIIRKNFGATHFIIGRDMAGTKSTVSGDDFYGPFDAQAMGEKYAEELAMKVAKYPNMVYVGEGNGNARGFATEGDAKAKGLEIQKLSGTKFRQALRDGSDVPDWFAFPAVVETLQKGGDSIFIK
jgi:sulfate adenylyltransferase